MAVPRIEQYDLADLDPAPSCPACRGRHVALTCGKGSKGLVVPAIKLAVKSQSDSNRRRDAHKFIGVTKEFARVFDIAIQNANDPVQILSHERLAASPDLHAALAKLRKSSCTASARWSRIGIQQIYDAISEEFHGQQTGRGRLVEALSSEILESAMNFADVALGVPLAGTTTWQAMRIVKHADILFRKLVDLNPENIAAKKVGGCKSEVSSMRNSLAGIASSKSSGAVSLAVQLGLSRTRRRRAA